MRLSLQTYFDLGMSYGLGDNAFEPLQKANVPDILGIGISNPLGLGRIGQLAAATIALWRKEAVAKVEDPNMDLGFEVPTPQFPDIPADFAGFKVALKTILGSHPILSCEITIYAIGVTFLRLDFAPGVPLPFAEGFLHCFEYAAYYQKVAAAILADGRRLVQTVLKKQPKRWWRKRPSRDAISGLSKRPEPEVQMDEHGYSELRLFPGFVHIAICENTSDNVAQVQRRLMPNKTGSDEPDSEKLAFEYHGAIHFNWAACVIEPRSHTDPVEPQIRRMLACIQIAHTFQGAGEAFKDLFLHQTRVDAEGFIRGEAPGLDYIQLNRLRTLALAVINLTRFENVTMTEEDQAYFRAYDRNAKLENLHDRILSNSEVLATVQKGESDLEQERRDDWLNTAVIFLTGFTVLTVIKDVYEFLKGEDTGFGENLLHDEVASGVTLLLVLVLVILTRKVVHRRSRRRR